MSGYTVDGEKLRALRRKSGMTQEELASLVDCSDRLIRKAERNGSLRFATIENIAKQLGKACSEVISTNELIQSVNLGNRDVAERFLVSFDKFGIDMLEEIDEVSEDFELCVAGDQSIIPFAGTWYGWNGLKSFLQLFFAHFSRKPNSLNPTFLECENQVTAKFYDQCAYKGHWLQRYWVDLHFTFREGEISRIENHYDTLTLHQDVLAVRQKLGEYQGMVS